MFSSNGSAGDLSVTRSSMLYRFELAPGEIFGAFIAALNSQ